MNKERFLYCRQLFEKGAYSNIDFIINKRYSFIKKYIDKNERGVEFGAGAGLSKIFLKEYNIIVTDFCDSEWLDIKNIDAQSSDFDDCSYDYIIMSNVLHHLDKPKLFFNESNRILKKGGRIIIIEPFSSILFKLLLKIKKHEQINYNIHPLSDCYSLKEIAISDADGNNAVGEMLFSDTNDFQNFYPDFEIIHKSFEECFVFINSGGQYVRSPYVPMPSFLLKFMDITDKVLIFLWKKMFALGLYIVIKKR